MKTFKQLLLLTFSPIIFMLPINSASASDFIGTFCWAAVFDDENPEEAPILHLGLDHIGDFHFAATGYASDGTTDKTLLNGNAEIAGNNLILSLHGVENDPEEEETYTISVSATLPGDTFSGPFGLIETNHHRVFDEAEVSSGAGTLNFVACP